MSRGKNKDILDEIYWLILAGFTIRQIADNLHTSKSSIHVWIHKYMKKYLGEREYLIVTDILNYNFEDKCNRGAQATKEHWIIKRANKETK